MSSYFALMRNICTQPMGMKRPKQITAVHSFLFSFLLCPDNNPSNHEAFMKLHVADRGATDLYPFCPIDNRKEELSTYLRYSNFGKAQAVSTLRKPIMLKLECSPASGGILIYHQQVACLSFFSDEDLFSNKAVENLELKKVFWMSVGGAVWFMFSNHRYVCI